MRELPSPATQSQGTSEMWLGPPRAAGESLVDTLWGKAHLPSVSSTNSNLPVISFSFKEARFFLGPLFPLLIPDTFRLFAFLRWPSFFIVSSSLCYSPMNSRMSLGELSLSGHTSADLAEGMSLGAT